MICITRVANGVEKYNIQKYRYNIKKKIEIMLKMNNRIE